MSSPGQALGAVVGGVAGFFLTGGNPLGAMQGAALGAGLGAALDPPKGPTINGPRLSDLAVQTSTYGTHIPRLYGTVGIHGNLLWLENNKLKETVRKKKQGGKGGGGGSTVKTYSYSATFALGLCEGPIAGVRRIWCMDKLIYNAGSDDLETIIASNQNAKGWRLYLGSDDQLPDPRYEADVGVGNAPAFRGMAYMVFEDFQLADYSNTLQAAQFKVEVVTGGLGTSTLLDTALRAQTAVTWESGAAFRDDLRGISYLSRRAVGGADVAYIDIGKFKDAGSFSVEQNLDNIAVRGGVSYDGDMWLCNQLNDIFNTNRFRRTSDLSFFEIYASALVRGIRRRIGAPDNQYLILYTSSGAGTSGVFDRAGIAVALADGGIVNPSIGATSGFRINTAGDQLHEFRVVGNVVVFRRYDESLGFISQHTINYPGIAISNVTGPFGSSGVGTQSCMRNGVLYICSEISGGYRVLAVNPDSVVDDYTVQATSGMAQLYAFYMIDDSEGCIVNGDRLIQFKRFPGGGSSLSDIANTEISLSSLIQPSDVDSDGLDQSVRGYRVQGGSIRSALEPLQAAFPFDVVQSGYKIKCLPRGQASVVTIPWQDLGAADGDRSGEMLLQSREMDSQLPARTNIKYLDAEREYGVSEQSSERLSTETVNIVDRELPIVLSADEAAGVAEILNFLPWLERTDASIVLPPKYLDLEASDVVTVMDKNGSLHELRLTELNYASSGRLEGKARPNRAALYSPDATGGEAPGPGGTVPLLGDSIFVPLDIPTVDESIQNESGFVGVMTGEAAGWPGAIAIRSVDGGQTWADIQGYAGPATIGTARGTLPAASGALIDMRTLIVEMISGELESITRDQMLFGQHYAAYGADGRWEIVQFYIASMNPDGAYSVSGFVRGQRGTEWAAGLHQPGDWFVMLDDPDNAFIGMAVGSIGVPALYRGVTSGTSMDDAADIPFSYQGVNLECLSPVHVRAVRDISGNLSATFTRRSRLSSTWWSNGVQAPVGEASQAYEVDVIDGSTVKRTITASTPTFSYSAADQTTDFGSPQSSITFRIYQLSETVGRGYVRGVTL